LEDISTRNDLYGIVTTFTRNLIDIPFMVEIITLMDRIYFISFLRFLSTIILVHVTRVLALF